MEFNEAKSNEANQNKNEELNEISFRCTYEIKDNNEIQILNDRREGNVNEEIKQRIKILNGNKKKI